MENVFVWQPLDQREFRGVVVTSQKVDTKRERERDAAAAKDNRKTTTTKKRTTASVHHSRAVQRSYYDPDLNYDSSF